MDDFQTDNDTPTPLRQIKSNSLLRLEARLSLAALDEFTDVMVKSRLGGFSSEEED